MPPALFFFLKIAFTVQNLSWFHTHFKIFCSISVKNAIGILIGIALNPQIALGSMNIFTILILPIHEHSISFYFFVSSSISFNVVQFSVYRSLTFLVKFIPRYFILFDTLVNSIVFLISLSGSSLFVCKNKRDFCLLIFFLIYF